MVIEVIAQSVADAIAAEAGGADRIELVRDLEQDGLTPPPMLVREVCSAVRIPVYVMIRPRNSFTLSSEERERLVTETRATVGAGARGLVTGYVTEEGEPDVEALSRVRSAAGPDVGLTFHRAFDRLADREAALPRLAAHGVVRVLTSGGAPTAWEGRVVLQSLVPVAERFGLIVMAGAGVTPQNVAELVRLTGVREVHFGAGVHDPPTPAAPVSSKEVAAACRALEALTGLAPRAAGG